MERMKYTQEIVDDLTLRYANGESPDVISAALGTTKRSVIAKLSSMGLYKRPGYKNKRGETPVKKSEYVDRIALLLDVDPDLVESLEKVNKHVLSLIEAALLKTNAPE